METYRTYSCLASFTQHYIDIHPCLRTDSSFLSTPLSQMSFNVINYHRNANLNQNEKLPFSHESGVNLNGQLQIPEKMQRDWILHSWWEECKMVQPVWKTSSFLENYMYTYFIIQQFHSKVFLQQKLKYMPHKYLHNSVDCSLIYNSKRFKQFKCPSTGE